MTALTAVFLLSGCSTPATSGQALTNVTTNENSPGPTVKAPSPSIRAATPSPKATSKAFQATQLSILDDLSYERVSAKYKTYGLSLSKTAYDSLSEVVCKDMQKGGPGYYTSGDVSRLSSSGQETLARAMWLAFAFSCYPNSYVHSKEDIDAIAQVMVDDFPEYQRRMKAAGLTLPSSAPSAPYSGSGQSYSSSGSSGSGSSSAYGGYSGSTSSGSGYSVTCGDGSISGSGGKQGACSHHGGVSR